MARSNPISNVKRSLVTETVPTRSRPGTKPVRGESSTRLPSKPEANAPLIHRTSIRMDAKLYQAIGEAVQSAKLGEDFHYANVSDFIRAALTDYKKGMPLTAAPQTSQHVKDTSVCLPVSLRDFWRSLPRLQHWEILDRVLRTKLERM